MVFRKEGVPLRFVKQNYSDPTWIKTGRYNDPVEIRFSKDTEDWKKSASQGGALEEICFTGPGFGVTKRKRE